MRRNLMSLSVRATRRGAVRLKTLAMAAGVGLGVAAAGTASFHFVRYAHSSVREQERFQLAFREVEITPLPRWLGSDIVGQVRSLADLPETLNTLDPSLAAELADAFSMHPWVREVVEVAVKHPATVRVKLEYREPVAVVRTLGSLEPVDRDCVLLPTDDLPDKRPYLTISGVKSTPTGPAGTKWNDPAVAAAAAIADALSPHHRTLGITAIDVSGFRATGNHRAQLYLLTDLGTRIKWGRPPGDDYPGEPKVDERIARLTQYVSDHGSLDKPAGPYEMDITHWQEISVRPRTVNPSFRR